MTTDLMGCPPSRDLTDQSRARPGTVARCPRLSCGGGGRGSLVVAVVITSFH